MTRYKKHHQYRHWCLPTRWILSFASNWKHCYQAFKPNCPPYAFREAFPNTHWIHPSLSFQTKISSFRLWVFILECHYDLVPINIKDQFIRGPSNTTLQIDILTKAGHLTIYEETVKHAEAFETALLDQFKLNEIANLSISHISNYRRQRQNSPTKLQRPSHGRGSTSYGAPESNNWSSKCPAWGKNCLNLQCPNYFGQVCPKEKRNPDSAKALLRHAHYNSTNDSYTNSTTNC